MVTKNITYGRRDDVGLHGCVSAGEGGLLDGKSATTHHDFFDQLEAKFPRVKIQRGVRFVRGRENFRPPVDYPRGIDLALRVVECYFRRPAAEKTAAYMGYQGTGWIA
jgi:transcriptional regulator GlxA family with amidase domain